MKMTVEKFFAQTISTASTSSELICQSIVENESNLYAFIISGISSFKDQQFSKWGESFQCMRVLSASTITFANQYIQYLGENSDEELRINSKYPYLFPLLKLFLGECISIYNEICCLLEYGYIYGAYILWRAMYEKCVVADFIVVEGEEMAKRYFTSDETGGSMAWAGLSSRITKSRKK